MKTSTVLALGGLGALAWYLSRQRPSTSSASPGAGASTSLPSDIVGDAAAGSVDFWLDVGRRGDHCDLPTGSAASTERDDAWNQEQLACAAEWHKYRADLFYKQVYEPASRVSISSLTKDDFLLAGKILSGNVDRSNVPLTYGQSKRINDMNDAVGWAGDVAHWIGVIADIFTLGLASRLATNRIENATSEQLAAYAEAVQAIPAMLNGGEIDLLLDPGPPEPAQSYLSAPLFTRPSMKSIDSPFINGLGPSMDFGFPPIEYPWGNLWFRGGLLAPDAAGYGTWRYGFVCRETGYADGDPEDKTPKADRITKIARAWRALDVWGAILKPYRQTVLIAGNQDLTAEAINVSDLNIAYRVPAGLHAYKVGPVELWGCTLPPHPDDGAIDLAGELGRDLASRSYAGDIPAESTQTHEIDPTGAQLASQAYVPPSTTISDYVPLATNLVPVAGAPVQEVVTSGSYTKSYRR